MGSCFSIERKPEAVAASNRVKAHQVERDLHGQPRPEQETLDMPPPGHHARVNDPNATLEDRLATLD